MCTSCPTSSMTTQSPVSWQTGRDSRTATSAFSAISDSAYRASSPVSACAAQVSARFADGVRFTPAFRARR